MPGWFETIGFNIAHNENPVNMAYRVFLFTALQILSRQNEVLRLLHGVLDPITGFPNPKAFPGVLK